MYTSGTQKNRKYGFLQLLYADAMSAQAKEISTLINEGVLNTARSYSYISPAIVQEDNVQMRRTPGLSGTVLLQFKRGRTVYVDKNNIQKVDGIWWYPCKYENTYGFVAAQYVYVIPT